MKSRFFHLIVLLSISISISAQYDVKKRDRIRNSGNYLYQIDRKNNISWIPDDNCNQARYRSRYADICLDEKLRPHGTGTKVWADGTRLHGTFSHGKLVTDVPVGIRWKSGTTYRGYVIQDDRKKNGNYVKHGDGLLINNDTSYSGTFNYGNFVSGEVITRDSYYRGSVYKGKYEGAGVLVVKDRASGGSNEIYYRGEFKSGRIASGEMYSTYDKLTYIAESFDNSGRPLGSTEIIHPDGTNYAAYYDRNHQDIEKKVFEEQVSEKLKQKEQQEIELIYKDYNSLTSQSEEISYEMNSSIQQNSVMASRCSKYFGLKLMSYNEDEEIKYYPSASSYPYVQYKVKKNWSEERKEEVGKRELEMKLACLEWQRSRGDYESKIAELENSYNQAVARAEAEYKIAHQQALEKERWQKQQYNARIRQIRDEELRKKKEHEEARKIELDRKCRANPNDCGCPLSMGISKISNPKEGVPVCQE